jgi:Asp-tRNA(Asn)/Glu-tRNA(Gln) amidotransferase A subunit family amidase
MSNDFHQTAPTLASLAADLAAGRTTSRKLVEACLAKIADPNGEGERTFIHVDKDAALAAADAMDALRKANAAPSRFAGIPISIKDLFDIKGQVTRAGSRALDDSAPADADAPTVARLRRAGFVVIGRTNMVEFAYSGIGTNPHYGTPKGAWKREVGHVPGGSSSGAAVSVLDGMAHAALGTDTGGSCRIPAAFNGIVGYKPTQRRVPLDGAVPLSFTLDSIGPLARSVACCAAMDAVLAGEPEFELTPRPIKGMRLAVPTTLAMDDLDPVVATAFERALKKLADKGAIIERIEVPEFNDIATDEHQGRLHRGGELCLASLSPGQQGRRLRSQSRAAHPARRDPERRRLSRSPADAPFADRAHRKAHRALRCAGVADLRDHAAVDCRHGRRQGVLQAEPDGAAQLHADQHDRRLRHLAADPRQGRSPCRPDAGRRRRLRPSHLRTRRGH